MKKSEHRNGDNDIPEDDSQTIQQSDDDESRADTAETSPPEEPAPEETIVDPGLAQPDRDETSDQTLELPEDGTVIAESTIMNAQTVADPQLMASDSETVPANGDQPDQAPASDDDRTIVEDQETPKRSLESSTTDNPTDDVTVVSDQYASPAPTQDAPEDATQVLPESGNATADFERATDPSDPNATIVEQSVQDPDATFIEGASAQEPDPEATRIEGATGATGVDGDSFPIGDQTKATRADTSDGSAPSTGGSGSKPPDKGAHETASRWGLEERYQLVSNFARGGLGQIWMASDARLRREVAYKELLPNALKNRSALERFLEEAQITGQLEHPSIVPIYDIGYQANGTPFYAMKLVRGETMEKEIDQFHQLEKGSPEWTLRRRQLLANFVDICNALAFAHDRGVLHRDLKPLNVMLGAFGETLVLDWGLAKVLDVDPVDDEAPITTSKMEIDPDGETVVESEMTGGTAGAATSQTATQDGSTSGATAGATAGASIGDRSQMSGTYGLTKRMVVTDVRTAGSQTMMGSIMGTPAYMPPEQAKGKLDELDHRSDIYSLGGILYKLLTNQQPIAKGKIREVLKNVTEGNITPPRQHDPTIEKPLEAITMKALARDREDRYDSALTIAADIEAWLADEAVSVFEDPLRVKLKRWARRHQRAVTAAVVSVAMMIIVVVGSRFAHESSMRQIRDFAQVNAQLSEKATTEGDFPKAKELLNEALGRSGDEADLEDLRDFLNSRLELVESTRLEQLRRDVETKLVSVRDQIRDGQYELAKTALARLSTLLDGETALPEIAAEVARQDTAVKTALRQQAEIAETANRFEQFVAELDQARVRSSFPDDEDVSEDAQLAIEHVRTALGLFDLNQPEPLARPPAHFSDKLPWAREWHRRTGHWPRDVLRDSTFELLLTAAEMEWWIAQGEAEELQKEAAERSLEWVAKAKTLGLKSQALLAREANYLQEAGRDEEAQQTFAQAKEIEPETALDFYLIAENLRVRGLFDRSLEFYLKAQQLAPDHYWVQHFLGLCYRNLGQHAAAASSFSSCIARRPDYPWAYVLRGVCSAELGQFENAHDDFAKAEQLDPQLFSVYVSRGVVHLTQRRFDDAITALDKARELKPDSGKPLVNISFAWFALAEELQKPDAINATIDGRPLQEYSDLEAEQKVQELYDRALETLDLAAQNRAANHPGLHQLRGQIFERRGQTDAAMTSYRRHLELDSDNDRQAFTLKRIGRIHAQLAEHDKAVEMFRKAYQLRPSDSDTVLQLAEEQLQLGDDQAAVQRYTQFIEMVNGEVEKTLPSPHLVYNGIATALHGMQKKNEAVDYYTLSLMFENRQAVPLTKRAWAYLEHGTELAIRDFQAAKELSPDNPDTLIGLASAYARDGQWQEAIREAEAASPLARQQAAQVGPRAFALFHNAATVYAQCLPLISDNGAIPAATREELSKRVTAASVGLLREAFTIARADRNIARAMLAAMQNDKALAPVRSSDEYRTFVSELTGNR